MEGKTGSLMLILWRKQNKQPDVRMQSPLVKSCPDLILSPVLAKGMSGHDQCATSSGVLESGSTEGKVASCVGAPFKGSSYVQSVSDFD
jgi:hypothetical protein